MLALASMGQHSMASGTYFGTYCLHRDNECCSALGQALHDHDSNGLFQAACPEIGSPNPLDCTREFSEYWYEFGGTHLHRPTPRPPPWSARWCACARTAVDRKHGRVAHPVHAGVLARRRDSAARNGRHLVPRRRGDGVEDHRHRRRAGATSARPSVAPLVGLAVVVAAARRWPSRSAALARRPARRRCRPRR